MWQAAQTKGKFLKEKQIYNRLNACKLKFIFKKEPTLQKAFKNKVSKHERVSLFENYDDCKSVERNEKRVKAILRKRGK